MLDLGCGPATLSIQFAQAFPHCEIWAVDGSAIMIELAKNRAEAYLQDRVHLVEAYIPSPQLFKSSSMLLFLTVYYTTKDLQPVEWSS